MPEPKENIESSDLKAQANVGPAPSPAIHDPKLSTSEIELPANLPDGLSIFKQIPVAKPSKYFTSRRLPHYKSDGRVTFVTFNTVERWILPEAIRDIVLQHCRHDDGIKIILRCAVVMPDHVHLLYSPRQDRTGNFFGYKEIVGGIKGSSAHSINKLLGRTGPVWQDERFDHIVRRIESISDKARYIMNNPVRRGLVSKAEDYKWLYMMPIRMAGEGAGPTSV